jgi:hypothetical protein
MFFLQRWKKLLGYNDAKLCSIRNIESGDGFQIYGQNTDVIHIHVIECHKFMVATN